MSRRVTWNALTKQVGGVDWRNHTFSTAAGESEISDTVPSVPARHPDTYRARHIKTLKKHHLLKLINTH